MSDTITRDEMLLNSIANHENSGLTPITREEQYLSYISGETNLYPITPITRKERFLAKIAQNGIGGGSGGGGDESPSLDDYAESGLTEIKLLKATKIRDFAFYFDGILQNIEMPNVVKIGMQSFQDCRNLVLTSLPNGLTNIGTQAFANCTKLALTSFPNSITGIAKGAFYSCKGLSAITFKGTPTSIGNTAFSSCANLKTINVPWAEGAVASAPWGATKATINYNYTGG